MNSSRTRFGRISIKALNCPCRGENGVRTGFALVHRRCLIRRSESELRRAKVQEKRSERGSERKALRVHSANGSRRPRERNGIPEPHLIGFGGVARRLPGGRVRSLQFLRDSSLSLLYLCWEYATGPNLLADDISLYGGRHRRWLTSYKWNLLAICKSSRLSIESRGLIIDDDPASRRIHCQHHRGYLLREFFT